MNKKKFRNELEKIENEKILYKRKSTKELEDEKIKLEVEIFDLSNSGAKVLEYIAVMVALLIGTVSIVYMFMNEVNKDNLDLKVFEKREEKLIEIEEIFEEILKYIPKEVECIEKSEILKRIKFLNKSKQYISYNPSEIKNIEMESKIISFIVEATNEKQKIEVLDNKISEFRNIHWSNEYVEIRGEIYKNTMKLTRIFLSLISLTCIIMIFSFEKREKRKKYIKQKHYNLIKIELEKRKKEKNTKENCVKRTRKEKRPSRRRKRND